MPIPPQFASFHYSQVFIRPDGVFYSGFHFLVGYVISVRDNKEFVEVPHLQWMYPLSMSSVAVHVPNAYTNMEMTRECISRILELMAFSLVTAAVVWAVLESTLGFDTSSDTIAPRYLKLRAVSSFLSMAMSMLMPLVLFVIIWIFSALICVPYVVEASSRCFIKLTSSCSCPAKPSMSSAKVESGGEQTSLESSNCGLEPFSYRVIIHCTGCLVMEAFYACHQVGIGVIQPHDCPQSCVPGSVEHLCEVYEDVVKILLVLQVFLTEYFEVESLHCCAPSCWNLPVLL